VTRELTETQKKIEELIQVERSLRERYADLWGDTTLWEIYPRVYQSTDIDQLREYTAMLWTKAMMLESNHEIMRHIGYDIQERAREELLQELRAEGMLIEEPEG